MAAPVIDGSEVPRASARPAHQFQFSALAPAQPPKPIAQTCMPEVLRPPPALAHTFQFFAGPLVSPTPPTAIKPRALYHDLAVGAPHLAHTFQFFTGPTANAIGNASFPGFGPAGAATFRLDLESGVKTIYSWGTDIFKFHSGREQRINTSGPRPKQRFEGNAFLLDGPARDLRSSLQRSAAQGSTFLLALPYEELNITAPSVAQTVTVASTALSDWAIVTQRVIVVDTNDVATQAVIQAVTATTIRLDITPGVSAGARIMPLIQVLLEPQQGFSRYAVNVELWSIRATANTFGWVGQDVMGQGAQIRTYGSGLVAASALTDSDALIFDRPNALAGTAAESMISLAELVDFGGVPFAAGPALAPDWARPIRYVSADAADWQWFKAFARQLRGRQRAFLLSTNHADLLYVSVVSSTLKVQSQAVSGAGDYTTWYASVSHRLLALTKADGSIQYVGVGSLTDNHDGTLSLGLDAVVTGTVSKISFLETVRIDNGGSDDIPVTWDGGLFTVELVARTVEEAVVVPVALPVPPLILMFGDSQIPGAAATDSTDPAFNAAATQSTTFVKRFDKHYALSASDPIVYETDVSGGVQPDHVGGLRGMSMEITMGQVFTAAGLNCVLASFGIFGLSCSQSIPGSTYPTSPPGGPNVLAQVIARTHALEASEGVITKVILLSEGNNDGANSTDAGNLGANSATLEMALLAAFPGARIIWIKINADTVNASGFGSIPLCISQQATFFAANPSIVPIYNDDCELLSDHAHFKADTALTVGQRVAFVALDLLSVARQHPATFPAVLGFGPQTVSAGTSMNPHSWGGAQAGDLEILVRTSLTASGTNNAFSDPAGWTLIATTTSATGGVTIRAGFYRRAVDASMITTNHGNTAPTTVPAVNSNEFAQIIAIRGINPAVPPTVEASALGVNNAFNTSLTFSPVTTLGANRTIVLITVGFRTNATANPVTITGIPGVTLIKNGTRDSGLSNFCTIDVQTAPQAVAGPSGTPFATLALASIAVGGSFSITP